VKQTVTVRVLEGILAEHKITIDMENVEAEAESDKTTFDTYYEGGFEKFRADWGVSEDVFILYNKYEALKENAEKLMSEPTVNDEEAKEETKKKLAETKKQKERLIELFTREHISIDEFEEKMAPLKAEISRLEYELTKLSYDAPSDAQFEKALEKTFRRIERITDIRSMTNAQLKEIIESIEVGKDGVVDIRLRAFEER
jgi:uncharacterized small protein (DUF1192 family)